MEFINIRIFTLFYKSHLKYSLKVFALFILSYKRGNFNKIKSILGTGCDGFMKFPEFYPKFSFSLFLIGKYYYEKYS